MSNENQFLENLQVSSPIKRTIEYHQVGDANNPVLSASMMPLLLPAYGGSIEKVRKYFEGTLEKKKPSKALNLGTMVHLWHESQDSFIVMERDKPEGKLGAVTDILESLFGIKQTYDETQIHQACAEADYGMSWKDLTRLEKVIENCSGYWKERADSESKIPITKSQREVIERIQESVKNNWEAAQLLSSDVHVGTEVPIYTNMEGVNCKGLIDRDISKDMFLDVKTTHEPVDDFMGYVRWVPDKYLKPTRRGFSGAFQKYSIYRQMAFYMLLKHHTEIASLDRKLLGREFEGLEDMLCKILVLQTVEPYDVKIYTFSSTNEWIKVGFAECIEALNNMQHYLSKMWG